MEKRKYDLGKYADMHDECTIKGEDGTEVVVRNHIPYADKETMARELAELMIMIHDDSCVYKSSEYAKYKKYMIAKYYTDIDTDGVEPRAISDFVINNDMWHDIEREVGWDVAIVEGIFDALYESVMRTYADDKSLTKAIRTSFSFLFTGEDVTESLVKAEGLKDTMFEAINALRKQKKEKEEKLDNGTLTVGGNIINFAKKE